MILSFSNSVCLIPYCLANVRYFYQLLDQRGKLTYQSNLLIFTSHTTAFMRLEGLLANQPLTRLDSFSKKYL